MKTLMERILEGLTSISQSGTQLTPAEQAQLARIEAYVRGETPAAAATQDADKDKAPVATVNPQISADVQALLQTVQAQQAQITSLAGQIGAQQATAQQATDNARVDTLVRQMKMTPAEATTWKQLAKDNPTAFQAAFATQEARPVLPQIRGGSVKARTEMSGDAGAELSRLTAARATEANISMGEAAQQIIAERPELAQAHTDNTPVVAVEGK